MRNFFKKIFYPKEYYKEINGYYKLNSNLREKLEYHDQNYGNKDFDKFFSWEEFKEIISVVHFLLEFQFKDFDIFILNDGKQYCYWIEYFGNRIDYNISDNIDDMLDKIKIQNIPMSQLWGNFE